MIFVCLISCLSKLIFNILNPFCKFSIIVNNLLITSGSWFRFPVWLIWCEHLWAYQHLLTQNLQQPSIYFVHAEIFWWCSSFRCFMNSLFVWKLFSQNHSLLSMKLHFFLYFILTSIQAYHFTIQDLFFFSKLLDVCPIPPPTIFLDMIN